MLELHIKSDEAMFNHIAEKTGKKKEKKLEDKDVV
jgi:hypothetical protein